MMVKFEQNGNGPNYTKFERFAKKIVNHLWQTIDAILEDVSSTETLLFDY